MVPQVELFSFVFWENWGHLQDISKLTDLYQQKYKESRQKNLVTEIWVIRKFDLVFFVIYEILVWMLNLKDKSWIDSSLYATG